MLRIIGRIILTIIFLPVKLAAFVLELALTVVASFIGTAGNIIATIGGIIAFLGVLITILSYFSGMCRGEQFLQQFLVAVAFGAVPIAITTVGTEVIMFIKGLLYRVIYL